MAALTRSEHTTYCPYKGDASYYSIPAGGDRSLDAVWTYETPFEYRSTLLLGPRLQLIRLRSKAKLDFADFCPVGSDAGPED
jgi:hypothetical protein